MYKITSRGKGWFYITHPVYGFIKQVRGYSNAIQELVFLEFHAWEPKQKNEMQFSTDDYFQSMINKETTT
jgi:hypothetical protein